MSSNTSHLSISNLKISFIMKSERNDGSKEKLFGLPPEKGRWLVVLAGTLIELCVGAIYAYGIISVQIQKYWLQAYGLKVTATELQIPFILISVMLDVGVLLVGTSIEKYGTRKVAAAGAVIVGLGWFLSSFATCPLHLAIVYGIIGGLGSGFVYNCPITASVTWFPDRRGLAVGLTVFGFGFSAAVMAPLADFLAINFGVPFMFQALGALFLVVILLLTIFIKAAPPGWKPAGWTPPARTQAAEGVAMARGEMVKTKSFYVLWTCFTIGTLAGLMAIGVSKPVGLEVAANAGIAEREVSTLLTMLAIPFACFSGFGRPIFGWLTDKLGLRAAPAISFILIFIASALLYTNPASLAIYAASFGILWLNHGAWITIAPAATSRFFGTKYYARNYGVVVTAESAGAIAGNLLAGQAKDLFGRYLAVCPYIMVLALLGLVLALIGMKPPKVEKVQ